MTEILKNLLDEPERILWHKYVKEQVVGETFRATQLVSDFIEAMKAYSAKRRDAWVEELCRQVVDQHVPIYVNHKLLAELVVPLLGRKQIGPCGDPARWLAHFIDQMYQNPPLVQLIAMWFLPDPREAKIALLKRALAWDPSNKLAADALKELLSPSTSQGRQKRMKELSNSICLALHEVPLGVLTSRDRTGVDGCDQGLVDVQEFCMLAEQEKQLDLYAKDVGRWRHLFNGYKDYLMNRSCYSNFADYLEKHPVPA